MFIGVLIIYLEFISSTVCFPIFMFFKICGDFNSRGLEDFIAGIDEIAPRKVIDHKINNYVERLVEFLINTNMCF